jgi:uncharacterized ion transporter superfamily protein YfcC
MPTFRLPHPLVLLVGCALLAAALSYVLPAGQYDRQDDPATGRRVVVAGTYHHVPPSPVGPFQAFVAIPRGIIDAAAVVAFVFLVGGAFGVVDQTGALHDGIDYLVRRLGPRGLLAIPLVCLAFAAGGAFENMQEEIIALIPALLVLTRRLGFDAMTAAEVSVGSAAIGSAFSPINPFQVLIAQKVAHLPQLSGGTYRTVFLAVALALWITAVTRHAARSRSNPPTTPSTPTPTPSSLSTAPSTPSSTTKISPRAACILTLVLLTFAVFVYGVAALQWDFDQEAALFLVMGILAGLIGRLGITGTANAFIEGFRSMAFAALLIGFARAISVVMEEGRIIDTVVHGLSTPLTGLPVSLAALGMMAVQLLIHVPVPSVSGQAVLTLPVFVPLADLVHLQRQVAVLSYQYGAGLCELITPTNGALMAILAAAGVRYDQWIRSIVWPFAALLLLGALAIILAVATGLQ